MSKPAITKEIAAAYVNTYFAPHGGCTIKEVELLDTEEFDGETVVSVNFAHAGQLHNFAVWHETREDGSVYAYGEW